MKPTIQAFFDPATATVTYVVHDATSAAIVDPVLDFDPAIQVNIRAGELPLPEENGRAYLKIPLNAF